MNKAKEYMVIYQNIFEQHICHSSAEKRLRKELKIKNKRDEEDNWTIQKLPINAVITIEGKQPDLIPDRLSKKLLF